MTEADIVRFGGKIIIPDNLDACWVWVGACDEYGYGRFLLNQKNRHAHRMLAEYICGPLPRSVEVCHTCDNPRCVNPKHLFLADHADNMYDSAIKGRASKVLTKSAVDTIKASGERQRILADRYGVSQSMISVIKSGKRWWRKEAN